MPIVWQCDQCTTVHKFNNSWHCRNCWCQAQRPDDDFPHQQQGPVPRTLGAFLDPSWSNTNGVPGQTGQAGGKKSGGKGKSANRQGQVAQIIQEHVPQHLYEAACKTIEADEGAQVAIASPLDLRLQQSLALALQFPYFVTYPCIFVLAYIHKYEYYQVNAICSPRNWD